jgi:hypothetical protein
MWHTWKIWNLKRIYLHTKTSHVIKELKREIYFDNVLKFNICYGMERVKSRPDPILEWLVWNVWNPDLIQYWTDWYGTSEIPTWSNTGMIGMERVK